MFLASKIAYAGIVFILLTTENSKPHPKTPDPGANLTQDVPGATHWNDVKQMQQTLQDRGHYRGKVDGVLGLRTRASIRDFQKAENLPVTGEIDVQTAAKLGVRPEIFEQTGYETANGKPSAGIKWANGLRRAGKTRRRPVEKRSAPLEGKPRAGIFNPRTTNATSDSGSFQ
jgi:peptidoglycan hydrolase-like protein with peptidoglycan-binding domain